MSLPAWARPGTKCICIDDAWTDVLAGESRGAYPVAGQPYVIAMAVDCGHMGYLVLGDQTVEPDYYQVDAFRPMTTVESDAALFAHHLKTAAATTPAPEFAF